MQSSAFRLLISKLFFLVFWSLKLLDMTGNDLKLPKIAWTEMGEIARSKSRIASDLKTRAAIWNCDSKRAIGDSF